MSQSEAMRCPERSRIVREQYADALPEEITAWAKLWNVSREAIRRRASELGIKRTAWVAQQAHLETARAMADVATECGSDEDYTALCLQQGGFPRAEIVNGQTAWVRPSTGFSTARTNTETHRKISGVKNSSAPVFHRAVNY